MKSKTSTKISDEARNFLKKLNVNIIKVGEFEEEPELSYSDLLDEIVIYFKSNNDIYTDMVKRITENV